MEKVSKILRCYEDKSHGENISYSNVHLGHHKSEARSLQRPGVPCSQRIAGKRIIPRKDSDVILIKNRTKGVMCLMLNLAVLYFNLCYK